MLNRERNDARAIDAGCVSLLLGLGGIGAFFNAPGALGPDMYRCRAPTPGQIRRFGHRLGIRSIIDLTDGCQALEHRRRDEIGAAHGIACHRSPMPAQGLPTVCDVLALCDLFGRVAYPALMHGGAARAHTDVAAVLYRHVRLAEPIAVALAIELRANRWRRMAVAWAFFGQYLAATADAPSGFFDWIEHQYTPEIVPLRARRWGRRC